MILAEKSVGMSSKLARQMIFKKKLEDEYRRKQYVREEADHNEEKDVENTNKKIRMKEEEKRKEENEEMKENGLEKREE